MFGFRNKKKTELKKKWQLETDTQYNNGLYNIDDEKILNQIQIIQQEEENENDIKVVDKQITALAEQKQDDSITLNKYNEPEYLGEEEENNKKYDWMDSDDDDENKKQLQQINIKTENKEQQNTIEDREKRTIIVCNLNFELSDQEIRNFFSQFGQIEDFIVPRNEGQLVNKGRAFIEYKTIAQAAIASTHSKDIFKGRPIEISLGLQNGVNLNKKIQINKQSRYKQKLWRKQSLSKSRSRSRSHRKDYKQEKKHDKHNNGSSGRSRKKSDSYDRKKKYDKNKKYQRK